MFLVGWFIVSSFCLGTMGGIRVQVVGDGPSDVTFQPCSRSCTACSSMVFSTEFYSAVTGVKYSCVYEVISCRSKNVVYLIGCTGCSSQYIGETVQDLRDRMRQHRGTTKSDKSSETLGCHNTF